MADQTPEVQSAPDNQQLQMPEQEKISLTPAPKAPPSAIDQETQLPQPGTPAGMSQAGMEQPAPANAPAPGTPAGEQHHHGVLGEIFQTLAGGKKAVWGQDASGNPVKTYEDLKPGEMAMGILAAAVTGMAGGYAAKTGGGAAGKARAFSAGFQAEQAAAEKKEAKGAEEAQQEFKNRNISDEKKLMIEHNAREQQKSISDLQTADIERQQLGQNIRQGKEIFNNNMLDAQIKRGADWNSYMTSGFTEMPHPVEPGKNFGFASYKEASEAGNEHPELLAGLPDHNTIIAYNPGTGLYVPLVKPKGYDEKSEMRFGKPDPKHPGKWIASGRKDETGQIIQPTMMTGSDYQNRISKLDQHETSAATAAEKWAMYGKYKQDMEDNKELKGITNRMANAGNRPFAMDTDTGNWIMNQKDRQQMQSVYMTAASKAYAAVQGFNKDLASGTLKPEDEANTRTLLQAAQNEMAAYKQKIASLDGNVDKSDALGESFINKFTHGDKFDADKALEHFDENVKSNKYIGSGMSGDDLKAARDVIVKKQQATAAAKKAEKEQTPVTDVTNPIAQSIIPRLKGQPADVVTQQLDQNKITDPIIRAQVFKGLGLGSTTEGAVAQAGVEKLETEQASQKREDLEVLKRIMGRHNLRPDIKKGIEAHPEWKEDEQLDFMKKMIGK